MRKNNSYFGKFYCPECHKNFRERVCKMNNPDGVIYFSNGLSYEDHVHCPRCEMYVPQKEDFSKKGKEMMKKLKEEVN